MNFNIFRYILRGILSLEFIIFLVFLVLYLKKRNKKEVIEEVVVKEEESDDGWSTKENIFTFKE
jgi:hypothetical protein